MNVQVPRRGVRRSAGINAASRRVRRRVTRQRVGPRIGQQIHRFPLYSADQPNRRFAKLRYVVHEHTNGPAAGAIVAYEYRANGMYDPECAVGGHQPYGFDQLMAKYNHFTVLKSTCQVEMVGVGQNIDVIGICAVTPDVGVLTAAHTAGGPNGLREIPIQSKDIMMTTAMYQEKPRSTYVSADMSKLFGKTQANLIGDSRFQGDIANDPTEQTFFSLAWYHPRSENLSAVSFNFKVMITYYAVFTEPKWFTTS